MHNDLKITVIVDNNAHAPFSPEHGLSLAIRHNGVDMLFDTGAGGALLQNMQLCGFSSRMFKKIILSHGHYDHTGGLIHIPPCEIWYVPGATGGHFSLHDDSSVHDISMPQECVSKLTLFTRHEVKTFSEIADGLFLTGAIPRLSGEDTGGCFFSGRTCSVPDSVSDEQALLTANGVLVQGCCHAGIINTLDFCRAQHPEIKIHTVIGGLHLLHASPERLDMTASALRRYSVRRLVLLHCTGANAADFLRSALPDCDISSPSAGDSIECY